MKISKEKNKLALTTIIIFFIVLLLATVIICFISSKRNYKKDDKNSQAENIHPINEIENTSTNQKEITFTDEKEALIYLCKDSYGEILDNYLIEKENFLAYFKPDDTLDEESLLYHQWLISYEGETTIDNDEFYVFTSWECFMYDEEADNRVGQRAHWLISKKNGNIIEKSTPEFTDLADNIDFIDCPNFEEIIFETTHELNQNKVEL